MQSLCKSLNYASDTAQTFSLSLSHMRAHMSPYQSAGPLTTSTLAPVFARCLTPARVDRLKIKSFSSWSASSMSFGLGVNPASLRKPFRGYSQRRHISLCCFNPLCWRSSDIFFAFFYIHDSHGHTAIIPTHYMPAYQRKRFQEYTPVRPRNVPSPS